MPLFPVTIDGKPYTCPELASHLDLPRSRVLLAVQEFHPTTMDALREAVRCQLSRPHPRTKPAKISKQWNGTGFISTPRIAK